MRTPKRRKAGAADIVLPPAALGAALTAWQDSIDRGLAAVAMQQAGGAVATIQASIGRGALSAIQESLTHHRALSAALTNIQSWQPPVIAWAESMRWYQESIGSSFAAMLESVRPTFDILRGIDWRRLQCRWALQAIWDGDLEHLRWFSHKVLRKPARYACAVAGTHLEDAWPWAVAEALLEQRWVDSDDPIAYLQRAAEGIAWRRYRQDFLWGPDGELAFLDKPVAAAGDTLGSLIAYSHDPFAEVETSIDRYFLCLQADLSPDELRLFEARCLGISRREMHTYLGWDEGKVERVWRSHNRKFERWRSEKLA